MELLATDPSTQRDVVKFCQFLGHTLLEQRSEGDCFYFRIQRCNNNN
jgi:tRNA 2-thiouridine synthesizing protein A